MSLDIAEAPAPAQQPLTLEQRRENFNTLHFPAVRKDLGDAWRHAKDGRFILVVTPQRVALRLENGSAVRLDMRPGCEAYQWLRDLYRAHCPSNMRIEFGYRTHYNAACGDHLENIFMMEVRFFLIGQPRIRRKLRQK